jgi:hypothetical protein
LTVDTTKLRHKAVCQLYCQAIKASFYAAGKASGRSLYGGGQCASHKLVLMLKVAAGQLASTLSGDG